MKHFRKIAAQLFGFDRRERRGTYLLAMLVMVLLIVRLFAFNSSKETQNVGDIIADEKAEFVADKPEPVPAALFPFDPNTATREELLHLGLTERQATTLVSYRNAGALFRTPHDMSRVYGIDSATVARLAPWVKIENMKSEPDTSAGKVQVILPDKKPAAATMFSPLDLNRCSASDLEQFEGIGTVLSARIIKYRNLLGGFVDTRQLREVYGLDSTVMPKVKPLLTLTYDSVVPLVLDTISYRSLARHPYVGKEMAGLIVRYRELMGVPVTLSGLVRERVISSTQAARLAPYVKPSSGAIGDDYEFILSKVLK